MRVRIRVARDGFTLIEMMIVMVVIATLLGVLLPQFRGAQDEASEQRARAELRTLATAIESFALHNSNALPAALSTLTLTTTSPRIVSQIPNDPFRASGNAYSYAKDTNGVYYIVWSYGRDRVVTITGISTTGTIAGTAGDDVFVTNGTGT